MKLKENELNSTSDAGEYAARIIQMPPRIDPGQRIRLLVDDCDGNTAIPNWFIDDYMPCASAEEIKVFLAVLRGSPDSTVGAKAARTGTSDGDVMGAIRYWEEQGIFGVSGDASHVYIRIIPPNPADRPDEAFQPAMTATAAPFKLFGAEETELRDTLSDIEEELGRPLTQKEAETVSWWTDKAEGLGLSPELARYLAKKSASKGNNAIKYADKIAMRLHDEGIGTVEEAEAEDGTRRDLIAAASRALGMNRMLAPAELEYVARWGNEYGMTPELVAEACGRAVISARGPSFPFADAVMRGWHEAGVKTPEEAAKADANRPAHRGSGKGYGDRPLSSFHNFEHRTYTDEEFAEIERDLLLQGIESGDGPGAEARRREPAAEKPAWRVPEWDELDRKIAEKKLGEK